MGKGIGVKGQFKDGRWALVDTNGIALTDFKYWFVEPCGEGYFRAQVTGGSKYNLLRPDGTEIFDEPCSFIDNVHHGLAAAYNTVRKTKTTPTLYLNGILHISGLVMFPFIANAMHWIKDKEGDDGKEFAIYFELSKKPYCFFPDGTVYDFMEEHLPKKNGKDNFPWKGVKGSVCEGCIYATEIPEDASRCGLLEKEPFRECVIKGICEHHKESRSQLSEFEKMERFKKREEETERRKRSGDFARDLVRDFINEKLDGDIHNLKHFDLNELRDDEHFGGCNGSIFTPDNCNLAKSIFSMVFNKAWHEMDYLSLDHYKYKGSLVFMTNTPFGLCYGNNCKGMKRFNPPDILTKRALEFVKLSGTVGNMLVLPTGLEIMRDSAPMGRGYMDRFLIEFYKVMIGAKGYNYKILDAMNWKVREKKQYKNGDYFCHAFQEMMLDDFLDYHGKPFVIFKDIRFWDQKLDRETYIKGVNEMMDFGEVLIAKRTDKIIKKLNEMLREKS